MESHGSAKQSEESLGCKEVQAPLLFNHTHDVDLYREGKLVILGLRDTVTTYRYPLGTESFFRVPDDPELTGLATAYYQCAFQLFNEGRYQ